jgi:glycosyltransferase involved in cell wall biosynthesis
MGSELAKDVGLHYFQVGSEGRSESASRRLWRLLVSPLQFVRKLLRTRARVVHLNTSLDRKAFWRDSVYLLLARAMGCKVLLQVHGGALPDEFAVMRGHSRRVIQAVMARAGAIVVLAQAELEAYRRFVPRQRVLLIPNAVQADDETVFRVDLESRPWLRVVYAGRLEREKGLRELVAAAGILADRKIPCRWEFAGLGSIESQLRREVEVQAGHIDVAFLGQLDPVEMKAFWRRADVFVLATYSEGLPYSLLEAMNAGVVPVATNVGAIPDVVVDSRYGILISPRSAVEIADAIQLLHQDRERLRQMGIACRDRIDQHYSLAGGARRFRELYEDLCQ